MLIIVTSPRRSCAAHVPAMCGSRVANSRLPAADLLALCCVADSPEVVLELPNFGLCSSNLGQRWPHTHVSRCLSDVVVTFGTLLQSVTRFGQSLTGRRDSAKLRPILAKVCHVFLCFCQVLPKLAEVRPSLTDIGPNLGQHNQLWVNLGPKLANSGHLLVDVGHPPTSKN